MKKDELQEYIELVTEAELKELGGMRLRDIIGQPIKDVVSSAGYAAERISAGAQTLLKGISLIIPSLITGLEFNYKQFAKDEQEQLDLIKKKYAETLGRNWEALKDPDVFGFMFLAYPQAMLGASLLKRSPLLFLRVLEAATGGVESVRQARERLELTSAYTPRQRVNIDPAAGNWAGSGGGMDFGGYGMGMGEAVIREAIDPAVTQEIMSLLQDPTVKQALANSQMFKEMQGAAVKVLVGPIQRLMAARSIDELTGLMTPEIINHAKQEISTNPEFQAAEPKAKQETMDLWLKQLKSAYKQKYIKWMQGLVQQTPEAGPEIQAAIQQIYAMR